MFYKSFMFSTFYYYIIFQNPLLSGASDPFNLITRHPDGTTHSKELKSLYVVGRGGTKVTRYL
jgi:hypothetical protein